MGDPLNQVVTIYGALEFRHFYPEFASEVKDWVFKIFPSHPRVRMYQAQKELQNQEWHRAVSLLEWINIKGVDNGTACHICHLLGLGLFSTGEVKKAAAWLES